MSFYLCSSLICALEYPLGLRKSPILSAFAQGRMRYQIESQRIAETIANSLPLVPDHDGCVTYYTVLTCLLANACGGRVLSSQLGSVASLGGSTPSVGYTVRELIAGRKILYFLRWALKKIKKRPISRESSKSSYYSASRVQ